MYFEFEIAINDHLFILLSILLLLPLINGLSFFFCAHNTKKCSSLFICKPHNNINKRHEKGEKDSKANHHQTQTSLVLHTIDVTAAALRAIIHTENKAHHRQLEQGLPAIVHVI